MEVEGVGVELTPLWLAPSPLSVCSTASEQDETKQKLQEALSYSQTECLWLSNESISVVQGGGDGA